MVHSVRRFTTMDISAKMAQKLIIYCTYLPTKHILQTINHTKAKHGLYFQNTNKPLCMKGNNSHFQICFILA